MVVRFCSWLEKSLPEAVARVYVGLLGAFVMSLNGPSPTCIVCSASMVDDGGVFSLKIGRGGGLTAGLRVGVLRESQDSDDAFRGSRGEAC